ncbi:MAG: CRISPR-associated endonuclease Cas3'' [Aristaeellaceae bacterium]
MNKQDTQMYYAKSTNASGRQITVREHLAAVSEMAGQFGASIGLAQEATLAGLLHDFGKYSDAFAQVLKGTRSHVDHAICGAALLNQTTRGRAAYQPVVTAINGHHDGLIDRNMLVEKLVQSVSSTGRLEANAGKDAALCGPDAYQAAYAIFHQDFPAWAVKLQACPLPPLQDMLRTRMLFSCLVDADYTVSARDDAPDDAAPEESPVLDAAALLERLYDHCRQLRAGSRSDPALNQLRDEVFDQCGRMGDGPEGLYTLTSPTGTGKTLAMLHFALRHCLHTGKQRIIVVLPFLTLTEQNARTYRSIVGDVLEDHSQSHPDDQARVFTARWNVPMIITTSVKFFESLFASQPGDCRKLHHIANSVILFDEAQTLPNELLSATLDTVKELCFRYRCTMVFSTATQPAFQAVTDWHPTEILPGHARLFDLLRRTRVIWRLDERTPLSVIAHEMAQQRNACAIVNLRDHARMLFALLREERDADEGLFFLTTDLCPAHRVQVVADIRKRQASRLPCLVVATQCIEAGIDLDFDTMYRALAPLESIVQAAGRCNRNGSLAGFGNVVVFEPDEAGRLYPGRWYEHAAMTVKRLHHEQPIDLHDPADMQRYYTALYRHRQDKPALTQAIAGMDYPGVDHHYRLISTRGYQVLVPYEGQLALFRRLQAEARAHGLTPALLREAAPITVSVFPNKLEPLSRIAERLNYAPRRGQQPQESDAFILRPQHSGAYSPLTGLTLTKEDENDIFFF